MPRLLAAFTLTLACPVPHRRIGPRLTVTQWDADDSRIGAGKVSRGTGAGRSAGEQAREGQPGNRLRIHSPTLDSGFTPFAA
jgi:hypothetical protein